MKFLKLSLCAAAASLTLGGAAFAQTAPTWSVNADVTSDYVFRGVSNTGAYDPAVQGGIDLGMGIGYVGTWASNVKFGDGTDAEIDLYGGIRPKLGVVSFDFGAIYYGYIGAPKADDVPYWEFKGAASVPAGPATLGAAVYYSPDFTFTPGVTAHAVYYEANAAIPIVPNVTLGGAVGRQTIAEGFSDYTTWNAGVTWAFAKHLSLDTRYWDTNVVGKIYGPRVAVTLKAVFP
jgi:uncharacterized protein (TIGR02001 family)